MLIRRCLVTGANGFLGQELCHLLKKNDIWIKALIRSPVAGVWDETALVDFTDENELLSKISSAVENVDSIFHVAGVAHTGSNAISKETYWLVNVKSTEVLLQQAIKQKVARFIYISSIKAIGTAHDNYSASKQAAEELVLSYGQKYNIHVCILRPTLIYGPYVKGNLLSMLNGVDKGFFPPIPEVGNQRSLISVQDVARATLLVAAHEKANGKIYTVTDGYTYSTRQLYDGIRIALEKPLLKWSTPMALLKILAKIADGIQKVTGFVLPFNSEALDKLLGSSWFSSEAIQNELGFQPSLNFFQALPDIIKAYKKQVI